MMDIDAMIDSAARSNAACRIEWPGAFTCNRVPVYEIRGQGKRITKQERDRMIMTRKIQRYISTLASGAMFTASDVGEAIGKSARSVGRCMSSARIHLFDVHVHRYHERSDRTFFKK